MGGEAVTIGRMGGETEGGSRVSAGVDPAVWVEAHGDALFRFAMMRVRDREVAEDLVQECFVAALGAKERFANRSSERTWLVGILKRKVVDHFRRKSRDPGWGEGMDAVEQGAFTEKGLWREMPGKWGSGAEVPEGDPAFWRVFGECLRAMPSGLAEVFVLYEMDGMSGQEVCEVLGLTPTNLWARLHRSRLWLRQRLDATWFRAS